MFYWGRAVFSPAVGLVAAAGLATSAQFMWTSHSIVMDSLLMLFTTAALFAAHTLVRGGPNRNALSMFYAAVIAALWTKGLIGPVLIASGLLAYAAARRSFAVLKPLHPFAGAAFVLLMVGTLAAAIAADAGWDAVREWLWVNHVQRFTNPAGTGLAGCTAATIGNVPPLPPPTPLTGGSLNTAAPVAKYVDYLDASGNLVTAAANWEYIRVWQITQPAGTIGMKQVSVRAQVRRAIGSNNGILPTTTVVAMKTFPF